MNPDVGNSDVDEGAERGKVVAEMLDLADKVGFAAAALGPVVRGMERHIGVPAAFEHLVVRQCRDPGVEIEPGSDDAAHVFRDLRPDQVGYPLWFERLPGLIIEITLDLDESGIGPVVGVAHESRQFVIQPPFRHCREIGKRDVLVDDPAEDRVEVKEAVIRTVVVGIEAGMTGLAGRLPGCQHDEFSGM